MPNIETISSSECPSITSEGNKITLVHSTTYINFDVTESTNEDGTSKYTYSRLEIYPAQFSKKGIIAALINAKYDKDDMQAIINNYLLDPDDNENAAQFLAMQTFRAKAKQIANTIINNNNK